jgi:hypothetical protein
MTPKPVEVPLHNTPQVDNRGGEHYSRMSAAFSSSIYSIGDLFKDIRDGPGSKSVKFPEKLLKVLEQKLQDIAMRKDPACVSFLFHVTICRRGLSSCRYSDRLLQGSIAIFWGQFKVESFKRQMKENRKIEELILMFVTHASASLRKDPSLAGDAWKLELNNQIGQFVKILQTCLRNMSHVPPELHSRLETYAARLAPSQTSNDSGYESASTSRDQDYVVLQSGASANMSDMTLVRTAAHLFHIGDHAVQIEIDKLKPICTEKVSVLHIRDKRNFTRTCRLL